jgi:hypothetical protein
MPMLAQASTGNVGTIMETFVVRQFPNAVGHYIGDQRNSVGNEMIVNVHTNMYAQTACNETHLEPFLAAARGRRAQRSPAYSARARN